MNKEININIKICD